MVTRGMVLGGDMRYRQADSSFRIQLHHWLARDPDLSPDFQIMDIEDFSAAAFTELAIRLCQVYEKHLHQVDFHRRDILVEAQRAVEMSFFLGEVDTSNETLRFNGYIRRLPYARGLHLVVTEYPLPQNPEVGEAGPPTTLLNEIYVSQLRRRIPAEDAQPYLQPQLQPVGEEGGEPGEESVSTASGNEHAAAGV